jgi:hypothetical protein
MTYSIFEIENSGIENAIPEEERSPRLKPFLLELIREIERLQKSELSKEWPHVENFSALIYPWMVTRETVTDEGQRTRTAAEKYGFDGTKNQKKLNQILAEDLHLKKCCVDARVLVEGVNIFIRRVFREADGQDLDDCMMEKLCTEYTDYIYQEPFRCTYYSHIFNFTAQSDSYEAEGIKLQRISEREIPYLFHERTPLSFLHPWKSGEFYVISETAEVIEDFKELGNAKELAENYVRILQYFKAGLVHVNYTVNFYHPLWLNEVRKQGTLFWGNNRRYSYDSGNRMYVLSDEEAVEVEKWWSVFQLPQVAKLFEKDRNQLGEVIGFAGEYFESSFAQEIGERRLIDLAIALEGAFSPGNTGEVTFQLSQLAAEFVGESPQERQEIFDHVKKIYGKRSELLHGDVKKASRENFVTIDELEQFSSIMRRGLLQFVVLYLRGETAHKDVIKKIRSGLFDPEIRDRIKKDSSIQSLMDEYLSGSWPLG